MRFIKTSKECEDRLFICFSGYIKSDGAYGCCHIQILTGKHPCDTTYIHKDWIEPCIDTEELYNIGLFNLLKGGLHYGPLMLEESRPNN